MGIKEWVSEPFASSPTGIIGTDHPIAPGQGVSEVIEVPAVTRQSMSTNQDMAVGRITPFCLTQQMLFAVTRAALQLAKVGPILSFKSII